MHGIEEDQECLETGVGGEIAEMQGLYGAYHVSETLLQRIWLRGEFDAARARLETGEPVRILHAGTWNRLGGPDFLGARLVIGDREAEGDVEVHFRAEAWRQHGHGSDPAYDNVVLHVVLFPPVGGVVPATTRDGRPIPMLVLMDLLWHDLEEYAGDEAVAALSGSDPLPLAGELLAMPEPERLERIAAAARERWLRKVHFARLRIGRSGWDGACHQTTLEILGYRSNRAGMLRVAARFPWAVWRRNPPATAELIAAAEGRWTIRGVRPANHPRCRLEQYRRWMDVVPDWPRALRACRLPRIPGVPADGENPAALRKAGGLAAFRAALARDLCGGALGGTRFDTWVCNLVLPFFGAMDDDPAAERWWRVWFPGDVPGSWREAARHLRGPRPTLALTNQLFEGLIGLQLAGGR